MKEIETSNQIGNSFAQKADIENGRFVSIGSVKINLNFNKKEDENA